METQAPSSLAHECGKSYEIDECCLRLFTIDELNEDRHALHASYRVAMSSNDTESAEHWLSWFNKYSAEVERRKRGTA